MAASFATIRCGGKFKFVVSKTEHWYVKCPPSADDDAEYDQYLADVTRLLEKMAGLPSCSRTDRARDALEILRS